ncbi:MAG: hypothetical protein RQ982_07430 [Gammaproteobacteria bacterium]|nr:hypothetical protein [Gammaproteobacteria bacterium]
MSDKNIFIKIGTTFIAIITLCVSFNCVADYEPYPGKHPVRLISVDAANILTVNFETWPGFGKTISVTLPDLALPGFRMEPSACELELAQKAMLFTVDFLASAKKISVSNLQMETSADEYGTANVSTEKGSLAQALIKEGLARPSSIDSETPWCK